MAFDHEPMVAYAHFRLAAKLSYTNIGFCLAPKEFAVSRCVTSTGAALGIRSMPPTCKAGADPPRVISHWDHCASWPQRGRLAALYRFTDARLRVTDEFAALSPPR